MALLMLFIGGDCGDVHSHRRENLNDVTLFFFLFLHLGLFTVFYTGIEMRAGGGSGSNRKSYVCFTQQMFQFTPIGKA